MEEYYASEADAREARPRRQTRPPQHLHDYEVSYGNHRPHLSPYHSVVEHNSPESQEEQYSHQERAAKMDSFTSLRLTPPTYQAQWDAVPQWDNPSHHYGGYGPEMQLAHSRQRGEGGGQHNEEIREATPHWKHWKKSADHQAELDMIRYENNKLHSTRLAITGQMAELERVKYEMMKLMDKASSLHPHSDATGNHYTPAKSTRQPPAQTTWFDSTLPPSIPPSVSEEGSNESEEEYNEEEYSKWPEPPPWPTEVRPKQQEGEQVVELLNRMMGQRFIPARPDPPVAAFGPPDTARQRTVEYQVPRPIHASFPSRPEPQPQWCIGPAYNTPQTYRGPRPTIPNFSSRDPSEFARLKIALENLLPPDGNEHFKYQILADHLKLEEACLVADSFLNSTTPYSDTMAALTEKFGQPHHVALKKIASVMDSPDVRRGDTAGFEKFALKIQSLVGMLRTLGQEGDIELRCGSHVARLLSKLPPEMRSDFRRRMFHKPGTTYTLLEFSEWLKYESWCQDYGSQSPGKVWREKPGPKLEVRQGKQTVSILHGTKTHPENAVAPSVAHRLTTDKKGRAKPYCPYCNNSEHYLNQCSAIQSLNKEKVTEWIKTNKKCWRCGRDHQASQCTLKKPCGICQGPHLQVLHEVNIRPPKEAAKEESCLVNTATEVLYLERPVDCPVESGKACQPKTTFPISGAFTASRIGLADHTYPVASLQKRYKHLVGIPLQSFTNARPLILIGADHPHLINPIEPVRLGLKGGPAAIKTRLGWMLQGPVRFTDHPLRPRQCLQTSIIPPSEELLRNVEKLWQVDTLPFRNEKEVTRSKQDQEAISLLEAKTIRVDIDGVLRYATPLLRKKDMPRFQAPREAVIPSLRSTERRLAKDPEKAAAYRIEMEKLAQAGSIKKLGPDTPTQESESWYIPHHMVSHNGKNRIVFNCSYQFNNQNLNDSLLPEPPLGASLLGVLLRFREHAVGISGDIKGMFHQVQLLPEDRPLLRFLWRQEKEEPPDVFEWQVLPFGTTCSPCCATFALQRHVAENSEPGEDVQVSVERCFYVDNCLQSLPSPAEARQLVDKLRNILKSGGFELRQWASNDQSVVSHLPKEARSDSLELWITQEKEEQPESTLGLSWHCPTDTLGYKHRAVKYGTPTMRNIYKVLASQNDPLGFILPYTTRAKVLVQRLWDKRRDWDDPLLPLDLLQAWNSWEEELQSLPSINLPRCYEPKQVDLSNVIREVHVFCDASEKAYGSVAYMRTEDSNGKLHLSIMARSRVAPKQLHSMPRLELCAAVTGAQLAKLLEKELTLKIDKTTLWTDSTTVLTWLQSESCRFKVFVGTRVAEIQELTNCQAWRYVDSARNPADDITRGKTLQDLAKPNRWSQGPPFLLQDLEQWPVMPHTGTEEDTAELRKSAFCGHTSVSPNPQGSDEIQCTTWKELLEVTTRELHGAASQGGDPKAEDYREAEAHIFRRIQQECFPDELRLLKAGKAVGTSSRLLTLAPELDDTGELIRVGGRLRRAENLDYATAHPIVLDPTHHFTRLLIKDYDSRLCHPGPERVFAEMRRTFWILRGREAIRRFQHSCTDCRRWKSRPVVPKMADLPAARQRLCKPVFYSTGTDCFGPFQVKLGRRLEKRWGIIFKCLTTRAVHLDILNNLSTDSFLMAFRRFIARRGTPSEIFSDQGTNFRGGERELHEAFKDLSPDLQAQLAGQKVSFHFNPPALPHFGGVWEREIRSVKTALYTTVGAQPVAEEVLRTVFIEVEGILNSKPLGYVSSDVTDLDPVTPNLLLMGRLDGSFPR
ncbi:hypothetical protein DPEC_G00226750 [Dallia pectoralis]|uniref:Uncharacterized protein n=1 Tax=Dallia pectoralis TaxID=75939 RepID=A0ACC2G0G5_DALPE|nr:hypothetical protein DPEC_G00226750 [Dallia pectoralis]